MSESDTATAVQPLVQLTEAAARRVRTLAARQGRPSAGLRVYVKKGGCAGYEYGMDLEDTVRPGDMVFDSGGITIYVDLMSSFRVKGSAIDFNEANLLGGGFQIQNPNVVATCSCGVSFRTEGSKHVDSKHGPARS